MGGGADWTYFHVFNSVSFSLIYISVLVNYIMEISSHTNFTIIFIAIMCIYIYIYLVLKIPYF